MKKHSSHLLFFSTLGYAISDFPASSFRRYRTKAHGVHTVEILRSQYHMQGAGRARLLFLQ